MGCEDNCCKSVFFHHTLLEYILLYKGYSALDADLKKQVSEKSVNYIKLHKDSMESSTTLKSWCPMNVNGKCIAYDCRPMICRFHGIPSQVSKPGAEPVISPGCGEFDIQCSGMDYVVFDRLPVYGELAQLEKKLREHTGFNSRIKMTIAEMIADYEAD